MRKAISVRISIAAIVIFGISFAVPSYSQTYGIYASSNVYTQLPTTDLGGGGIYAASTPTVDLLAQTVYSIAPYGHSDSVTAFDPSGNAIYTASASASVNFLQIYNGQVAVSAETSGGSVGPAVGVQAQAGVNGEWFDTLYVAGPPAGTPVTLQFTYRSQGNLQLSGSATGDLNEGLQIANFTCGSTCDSVGGDVDYQTSTLFDSTHVYDLNTFSGAALTLTEFINSNVTGGSAPWSGTVNAEDPVSVASLTSGALVTSASGIDYSLPTSPVPLPATAWLLVSGLGGLVALASRRRAA